jgi:hypothetical protein
MRRTFLLLTLYALDATILAQAEKPLPARRFNFDNYRSAVVFNMKALRDTGVWDEFSTSPIKTIAGLVEDQFGFDIDHLDRATMTRGKSTTEGQDEVFHNIWVIEGNSDLGQPSELGLGRYTVEKVGRNTLLLDSWGDHSFAMPEPKLHVYGPAQMLRDVLDGRPRAGLPSADVMAFTAGQKNNLLHFIIDMKHDEESREELLEVVQEVLEATKWPEGDAPTMASGRISATGDEDDPHITLEIIVRHGTVGEGLAITEQAGNKGLETLKKLPQARIFWSILKHVEHERHGTDAVWRVDLGRARNLAGILTTLAPFILFSAEVSALNAIELAPAVPAPPKVKANDKPKQSGGK